MTTYCQVKISKQLFINYVFFFFGRVQIADVKLLKPVYVCDTMAVVLVLFVSSEVYKGPQGRRVEEN